MSIRNLRQHGDNSKLPAIHNYLYEYATMEFSKSQHINKSILHHINPIQGQSNSWCKFVNACCITGFVTPRHIRQLTSAASTSTDPEAQVKAFRSQLSNENSNSNEVILACDSVDMFEALVYHPGECNSFSDLDSIENKFKYESKLSISFSFHGTPTKERALDILTNGYNPHKRKRKAYGVGEYHSDFLHVAKEYGDYIIINCCIKSASTFSQHNDNLFNLTTNPSSNQLTYILPLCVFCATPIPSISLTVLPNLYNSPVVSSNTCSVCWSVENHRDASQPNKFNPSLSLFVEEAYQAYKKGNNAKNLSKICYWSVNCDNYFYKYILDFSVMKQINTHSSVVRPVQRDEE